MSTTVMTHAITKASADLKARLAGICYVLAVLTAISGEAFLRGKLGFEAGLIAVSGLGWLIFVSPQLAERLSPYHLAAGFLGEGSLMMWLLIMGVNVRQSGIYASAAIRRPLKQY